VTGRRNQQDLDRKIGEFILEMTAVRNTPEVTQLYQDTSDELRRLLVSKVGNQEQADQIARDAYLKLCRLRHNRDIRNLRSYLFNMAVRLAINVLRKRKSQYAPEAQAIDQLSCDSAYRALMAELKTETLKEAIGHLPEKTRYIFLLYRFEGLSYESIAERLRMSATSVEEHVARSLETVRHSAAEFSALDEQVFGY